MSSKILKFIGSPTTKLQFSQIFAKLNGNHLPIPNILKLHEYQGFGLMKMHNINKFWYPNNKVTLGKGLVYN